ncbi:PH1570 family protein [Pyrococcus abyssi]|nr:PH1570 family protein [Pyrococcus abyssi]
MMCEEKLEVFENGFRDDKFNIEVTFYGEDGRKVLLALIYELYLPDYGSEYVYPFECAKEFWNVYMDPPNVEKEVPKLKPIKFVSESVKQKVREVLEGINPPVDVKIDEAEFYKTKEGYLVIGKNFLLDPKGRLFIFNKPSIGEKILKYIWEW